MKLFVLVKTSRFIFFGGWGWCLTLIITRGRQMMYVVIVVVIIVISDSGGC